MINKPIIQFDLATTGFWFRICGYGLNIRFFTKKPMFMRSWQHIRIGKIYIYLLMPQHG